MSMLNYLKQLTSLLTLEKNSWSKIMGHILAFNLNAAAGVFVFICINIKDHNVWKQLRITLFHYCFFLILTDRSLDYFTYFWWFGNNDGDKKYQRK